MKLGDKNASGEVLIFDKWANEGGIRVKVWALPHAEIRIELTHYDEPPFARASLASYRADDLARCLARGEQPNHSTDPLGQGLRESAERA